MKFSGYWVRKQDGDVRLEPTEFDETELDPKTDWKEAWQNADATSTTRGYVDQKKALLYAAHLLLGK